MTEPLGDGMPFMLSGRGRTTCKSLAADLRFKCKDPGSLLGGRWISNLTCVVSDSYTKMESPGTPIKRRVEFTTMLMLLNRRKNVPLRPLLLRYPKWAGRCSNFQRLVPCRDGRKTKPFLEFALVNYGQEETGFICHSSPSFRGAMESL